METKFTTDLPTTTLCSQHHDSLAPTFHIQNLDPFFNHQHPHSMIPFLSPHPKEFITLNFLAPSSFQPVSWRQQKSRCLLAAISTTSLYVGGGIGRLELMCERWYESAWFTSWMGGIQGLHLIIYLDIVDLFSNGKCFEVFIPWRG